MVIGTRNTQTGNTINIGGQTPNQNNSTRGTTTIYGSQNNQADGRFLIFGRVNKTEILLPPSMNGKHEVSRYFVESINGATRNVEIMNPIRHQEVQKSITSLTQPCQQMKEKLYQFLSGSKNAQTIRDIIRAIISTETKLRRQQNLLDEFNSVMSLNFPKRDHFDIDLEIITIKVEELIQRTIEALRPQN